jgi:hypothetical protein
MEIGQQCRQRHLHQIWLGLCHQVRTVGYLSGTKPNHSVSILISAADTWLHVTTKSVQFFKLERIGQDGDGHVTENVYIDNRCFDDRYLRPYYDEMSGTTKVSSCAVTIGGDSYGTAVVSPTIELLGGVSDRYAIYNYTEFAYVGYSENDPMWYDRNKFDFMANAFAVSTTCRSIATDCTIPLIGEVLSTYNISDIPFSCTSHSAFSGNLGINPLATVYFTDPFGTDNNVTSTVSNTIDFGLALAVLSSSVGEPEFIKVGAKAIAFLACTATIHEVDYIFFNRTVRSFVTHPANASVGRVFMLPAAFSDVGHYKLFFDAQIAAAQSRVFQDFVDSVSLSFSKMVAALAHPALERTTTTIGQQRTSMIMAKLPKAPLFVLVAANLLFAVAAVMLAVEALRASRRGAPWQMKLRLGIPALVAHLLDKEDLAKRHVEKTKELFPEFLHARDCKDADRICLEETMDGGWELKVIEKSPQRTPEETL